MNFVKAFSTLGCPELSLSQCFALAQRHGVPAVELRVLGGAPDLPAYLEQTHGTPAALAAALPRERPALVSLGTSLRLLDGTPADRDALLRFVPWAEALGVPRLRVFDGGESFGPAELARGVEVLAWWNDLRRRNRWRVDLMVETHDTLLTSDALRRFLSAAPGAAILWDAHHTWRKGGEDPARTFQAIGPAVCHIHVKDSVAAAASYAYVLPGTGAFPMATLLQVLRDGGFDGPVSLEWERLWCPHLPPLEEALTSAAAHGWWGASNAR